MRSLRVLVVDDSTMNRRILTSLLEEQEGVELAGVASDGDEALRKVSTLAPDLITLDLEMPRMDGFTFLRLLMASRPTPVIVVSSHSAKDNVFRALELGAIDFIAKPDRQLSSQPDAIRPQLAHMVSVVRQLSPAGLSARQSPVRRAAAAAARPVAHPDKPSKVVVIASSTGGPTALVELFSGMRGEEHTAVVVAQHMPDRFTYAFAERLDRLSTFQVKEASEREHLVSGMALVCPGGRCIEVRKGPRGYMTEVVLPADDDRYAPSGDRLFITASRAAGADTIGVVLTGMGDDGSRGVVSVREAGGVVLAESEESAVVYGMPRAAAETGAVNEELPLNGIVDRLSALLTK